MRSPRGLVTMSPGQSPIHTFAMTASSRSLGACRPAPAVSTVHTKKQVGHCKNTSFAAFLSKYCQWVAQFRLLWHSGQPAPWSQFGHANHARLLGSASGSKGEWLNGAPNYMDGYDNGLTGQEAFGN